MMALACRDEGGLFLIGRDVGLLLLVSVAWAAMAQRSAQPVLGRRSEPLITVDDLKFKDLNHNGRLDRYEDWRLPAADLVSRMNLDEKAGLMMHGTMETMTMPPENCTMGSEMPKDLRMAEPMSWITRRKAMLLSATLRATVRNGSGGASPIRPRITSAEPRRLMSGRSAVKEMRKAFQSNQG